MNMINEISQIDSTDLKTKEIIQRFVDNLNESRTFDTVDIESVILAIITSIKDHYGFNDKAEIKDFLLLKFQLMSNIVNTKIKLMTAKVISKMILTGIMIKVCDDEKAPNDVEQLLNSINKEFEKTYNDRIFNTLRNDENFIHTLDKSEFLYRRESLIDDIKAYIISRHENPQMRKKFSTALNEVLNRWFPKEYQLTKGGRVFVPRERAFVDEFIQKMSTTNSKSKYRRADKGYADSSYEFIYRTIILRIDQTLNKSTNDKQKSEDSINLLSKNRSDYDYYQKSFDKGMKLGKGESYVKGVLFGF